MHYDPVRITAEGTLANFLVALRAHGVAVDSNRIALNLQYLLSNLQVLSAPQVMNNLQQEEE